ncbi:MAG: DUF983 domain-containing protein [Planctomycetota bacterium]
MSDIDGDSHSAATPDARHSWQLPESANQAFLRGLSLRCPLCSTGSLFIGWIRMRKQCDHCGFLFDRGPGYFLGSTYINYGVTTLSTTATYIWLRFGLGVPRNLLVPGLAAFCVIFPLVFFRYSRSLWLSFDCWLDRHGALDGRDKSR